VYSRPADFTEFEVAADAVEQRDAWPFLEMGAALVPAGGRG